MCGSDRFDLFCVLFIRYKAVYNYKPQNSDELELREGDIVQVVEKCDDGWFVGMKVFFFLKPPKTTKNLFFPSFISCVSRVMWGFVESLVTKVKHSHSWFFCVESLNLKDITYFFSLFPC